VLLSPVLVAIAILVWVDSPGSPLYGGWRVVSTAAVPDVEVSHQW